MLKRLLEFFKSKQSGQSMIFVAAMAPFAALFLGAALDFGWLYLNQSRLQNAADAAATAGASNLIGYEQPLSDYSYTTFIANTDSDLQKLIATNVVSSRNIASGNEVAKLYAKEYLQSWLGDSDTEFVTSAPKSFSEVQFEPVLYGKNTEDYEALYYTITLTTRLDHLFGTILDFFGVENLNAKAMAAVKITHVAERSSQEYDSDYPHGPTLYQQMKAKEAAETFPHFEEIGKHGLNGNKRSVLTGGSYYQLGNLYRTEASHLNGYGFNTGSSPSDRMYHDDTVDQTQWDDLFIDFEPDISSGTWEGDTDLSSGLSTNWQLNYGGSASKYYRIHFPIMIEATYPIRSGHEPPDSLYAFIEQEPIRRTVTYSDGKTMNRGNMSSVHQILINNNVANTNVSTDRPMIFFYEGPEIPTKDMQPNLYDGDDYIGERPFLPIILNLYSDFRGIVFAPNNPVIINGNGHVLEGFVVAREFRRLKTSADFVSEGYQLTYYNGSKVYAKQNEALVQFSNSLYTGSTKYSGVKGYGKTVEATDNQTCPNGYFPIKAKIDGVWIKCYLQNGQYYTNPGSPSDFDAEINDNGTTRYAFFSKMIIPVVTIGGVKYALADNGKEFYMATTLEYSTNGTITYSQYVNEMFLSGTAHDYQETYYNVKGETKTKTTKMAIGDVAWMPVTTVSAAVDSETGKYTETPGDASSFKTDDTVRYDYVTLFNLNSNSTYNSFLNVGLVNYTYLSKNESSSTSYSTKSHDMFFTTYRSKHID